jgi:unsaturated rhamnogalacturonyl hydrolase
MKKIKLIIPAFVLLTASLIQAGTTTWAVDFADAIMARWPSANGGLNAMTSKGWEYSNGIVYQGIQKVYEATKDTSYINYIKKYVDAYVSSDGSISTSNLDTTQESLDKLQPGVLCLFLYRETGLEKYKTAAEYIKMLIARQPKNSYGGFWHKKKYPNQMWTDGIYMAEPFVSQYGYMFDDRGYCDSTATFQPLLLASHAYDSTVKLLCHAWDARDSAAWADKTTGLSPAIWSRGMGWFAVGMVDILKYIPKDHYNYNAMITLLSNIAEGLKNTQDASTGLWYEVVDQSSNADNWLESSGSGLFVYALKTAVDYGFIDKSYLTVAEKGWEGLKIKFTLYSDNMPQINDYCGAMSVQSSAALYLTDTLVVDCPTSKHPHGYCAALFAASAMELSTVPKYRLNISTSGSGSVNNPSMELFHDSGTTVTVTASPKNGYSFTGWNGDASGTDTTITITMNSEKTITAIFSNGTAVNSSGINANAGVYFNHQRNSTKLTLMLLSAKKINIELLNIDGRKVADVAYGVLQPGKHVMDLKAKNIHSGMYLIRMKYDNVVSTAQMTFIE